MDIEILLYTLLHQLRNMISMDEEEETLLMSEEWCTSAYGRTVNCLSYFSPKFYSGGLNPCNSVIYNVFLYWLGHLLYINNKIKLADKVYYLNKLLNCNDMYYAIELPAHWLCEHPVGTVLGRAEYGDCFFFYQGCTVGGSLYENEIHYPVIGNEVTLFSDAKILGRSYIGNNCVLSANTYVINEIIPDNSLVFGQSPNIILKKNTKSQKEWLGL